MDSLVYLPIRNIYEREYDRTSKKIEMRLTERSGA